MYFQVLHQWHIALHILLLQRHRAINAIVVSNATGANFVLGQTVSIGTSNSNDSVAKDRIVTQIDVDTPNAGETTITFDGAAVNIAIGMLLLPRAWKTGMTDGVKVSGTHALNDGRAFDCMAWIRKSIW